MHDPGQNHVGREGVMSAVSRRNFLATAGFVRLGRARARRHGTGRQVRSRHQGRRRARSEPVAARQARHRHPLRRGRGGGGRHSGGAGAACAGGERQAGDAGTDRPAFPRLSLRIGDRHSGRRAGGQPMHDHLRVGRRRRRQQFRGLPPARRGAVAHAALRLRAYRQYRACRLPGAGALQHRLSRAWTKPPGRWPRTPTWCSASRCGCRRT